VIVFRVLVLGLLGGAAAVCCQPQNDEGDALGFFDQRAERICRKNFACCVGDDLLSASEKSCVDSNTINNYAERLRSSLRRGTATLDQAAASACFAAIDKLSCGEWALVIRGDDPDPCQHIVSGSLDTGANCAEDYDCRSLYCAKSASAGQGKCAAKGTSGVACLIGTSGCVDGLSCLDDGSGATICTARKREGDACRRAFECASAHCKDGACRPECWGEVLSHELFGT
jgi:hypothetical protein